MWSTNLHVKICRWGGGGKEKEPKNFTLKYRRLEKSRLKRGKVLTEECKSIEQQAADCTARANAQTLIRFSTFVGLLYSIGVDSIIGSFVY